MSKPLMKQKITPTSGTSSNNISSSLSNFKSSQNYLWNTTAVLGKGATGAVYFGHNKHNGETVAVKCFNHLSHMRPYEVQKREFEVLKKVNHENIVKLLAIEEENDTKQKVLVMELCTGGSLFNILDDPMNGNGIEEREFLLVLKHLAAGMKHLRDMNIIHRDLKPGNIMKFVSEDGTSIYKLTDFGAARELDDDQQFMSLYGTEEYLHPDMYERAVLRKPVGKSFKANVDLWSIGVTLYHIATGSLPFRPYGGRKNKETMYKITTEKASGIISGIQTSENGEIKWSRTLPESCLLSPSVQPLVTELLAGLLECDAHRMWSFEKFFSSVTKILEHKIIYVYYVGTLSLHAIYCHQNETVLDLKSRFESQYKVSPNDQILIWPNDDRNMNSSNNNLNNDQHMNNNQQQLLTILNDLQPPNIQHQQQHTKLIQLLQSTLKRKSSSTISTVIDILSNDYRISDIQTTTEQSPLFLLNGQMNSKIRCTTGPIPASKFPEIVSTAINTDVDAQLAKLSTSLAYQTLRKIDRFIHNYRLACKIPSHMLQLIDTNMKILDDKYDCFQFHLNILKERLDQLYRSNQYLQQLSKLLLDSIIKPTINDNNEFNNINQIVEQIQQKYDKLITTFHSLSSSSIMDEKLEQLKNLWQTQRELDCIRHLLLIQSNAKIYTAKIRDCWLMLHKDKQIKSLNHHEEELHQLEKLKLNNYCKKLNDLLSNEINPCCSIADKLEEWYQGAQVAYVKPQLIITELYGFITTINDIEMTINKSYDDHNKMWNNLFKEIKIFENEWSAAANGTSFNDIINSSSSPAQISANTAANKSPSPSPSSSLKKMTNNSIFDSTTLSSTFFKELNSLHEDSQKLKEAYKDFVLMFSEVQSINN